MNRRRSLLALAFAGLFVAGVSPGAQVATPTPTAPVTVTFAHFNDVYEIDAVENGAFGGMARLATALDRLRRTNAPVLTTLGGDYLSPSALGTAKVDGEPLAGRQMVDLLNSVGLQWATFGNHEFDVTEAAFHKRLSEGKFKVVVSNVTDAAGKPFAGTVESAVVPVRSGGRVLRIGLIGLVIDSTKKTWVKYLPPVETARAQVATLKGKVDAVVALTHLSLLEDQALVEGVPEIDLVLGGHEHENWSIRRGSHFTPIVKADANVRSLAVVTMRFAGAARPTVSVRFDLLDSRVPFQPRVQALVKKWVDTAYEAFRRDGFDPAAVVANIPEPLDGRELTVRNRPGNLTALITEAMQYAAKSEAAILNGGSIRIDDQLQAGPVRQYDVIRVLPFGGNVVKVTLDGALLRQILEAGEANIGSGGFLHLAGIIRSDTGWSINGRAMDAAATYTVAMPAFLLTGQEARMAFLTQDKVKAVEDLQDIRLILIDALRRKFPAREAVAASDLIGGTSSPPNPLASSLAGTPTPRSVRSSRSRGSLESDFFRHGFQWKAGLAR